MVSISDVILQTVTTSVATQVTFPFAGRFVPEPVLMGGTPDSKV